MITDNLTLAIKTKKETIKILSEQDEIGSKEALDIAIMELSLLLKSVPEQVIDNGHSIKFCPDCHGSVWQNKDESKFCFRCGQKLKW